MTPNANVEKEKEKTHKHRGIKEIFLSKTIGFTDIWEGRNHVLQKVPGRFVPMHFPMHFRSRERNCLVTFVLMNCRLIQLSLYWGVGLLGILRQYHYELFNYDYGVRLK